MHNRRRLHALAGSDQWEEFEAEDECWPILDGAGNRDEFRTSYRPGYIGMSLRLFDPQSRLWSIYWIDNRNVLLQTPVVVRFTGNGGTFLSQDNYDGKPITVRYRWSNTDTDNPRWDQSFSDDGGATWEVNWTVDMRRPQD